MCGRPRTGSGWAPVVLLDLDGAKVSWSWQCVWEAFACPVSEVQRLPVFCSTPGSLGLPHRAKGDSGMRQISCKSHRLPRSLFLPFLGLLSFPLGTRLSCLPVSLRRCAASSPSLCPEPKSQPQLYVLLLHGQGRRGPLKVSVPEFGVWRAPPLSLILFKATQPCPRARLPDASQS